MSQPEVDHLSILKNSVLPEYSVSPITGFAPPKSSPPATKFSFTALTPWLEISQKIPELLKQSNAEFRTSVDQMPLLSMPDDAPVEEWRLAYVILSTLAAAYVWGSTTEAQAIDRLPYALALPLRDISYELEVEPGIAYVAGGIWNHFYNESLSQDEDGQLDCIVSLTGTPDETHFNLTTLRVERAGGEGVVHGMMAVQQAIQAMQQTRGTKPDPQDHAYDLIAESLRNMSASIEGCTIELKKMRNGCEPSVFYNQLRPFLSGFGSNPNLPKGVFYPSKPDGTPDNGQGEWLKLSGATAGQSSLFQAFDILLGVKHPVAGDADRGVFVKAMRKAMPGCHAQFLESISALPSLRRFMQVIQSKDDTVSPSGLGALEAYNEALSRLEQFRNEHFKIVALYVIGPARQAAQAMLVQEPHDSQLRGTGGSDLSRLLKGMREDTQGSSLPRD